MHALNNVLLVLHTPPSGAPCEFTGRVWEVALFSVGSAEVPPVSFGAWAGQGRKRQPPPTKKPFFFSVFLSGRYFLCFFVFSLSFIGGPAVSVFYGPSSLAWFYPQLPPAFQTGHASPNVVGNKVFSIAIHTCRRNEQQPPQNWS